jgi:hypothetical protein
MTNNFDLRSFLSENKLTKNAQLIKEGSDYGYEALIDVVDNEYDGDPAILAAVEDAFYNGGIDTSDFGHDPSAPSNAVAQIANGMDIEASQQSMGFEEGTEGEEVPENPEDYTKQPGYVHETLTAKERRLVEMVQKALRENYDTDTAEKVVGPDGVTRYVAPDEPTAIDRMYNSDEYVDALKSAGMDEGEEGSEMADETVIPEYGNIEELMKEIDSDTNKISEEHKIKKMKAIAEALRMKVKGLEEGEHAEHIDQKAVKQMSKDIAALEKTAAKLQGLFDKRFNKKEKTPAPKKEKEVVALQEGNFDLRKFLAENRK